MSLDSVLQGNALHVLRVMPANSVDCCVTSPPYWGLRDYGVPGQLGLEPDFRDYIKHLVDIFDEVKRVLKPGGTCWVNLGDTYFSVNRTTGRNDEGRHTPGGRGGSFNGGTRQDLKLVGGLTNKSLTQVPARFAIEMTDRGWILRNEIIWHKPNAMPQSVKDRFSVDYEKLFFFTKSKRYYFNQQFEPHTTAVVAGGNHAQRSSMPGDSRSGKGGTMGFGINGRNKRSVWSISTKPYTEAHFAVYPEKLIETPILAGCPVGGVVLDPFFGSGTTGVVAQRLNRAYIGIELNAAYVEIAQKRLAHI